MSCPRLLRLNEVTRLTSLSKSSIYRLEAIGRFPTRVRLGDRASGWFESEVEDFVTSRPRLSAPRNAR